MLTSEVLKKVVAEARPLIERQLDLAEQIAGLREVVTSAGGDWSQLKALVKAQIQDERDEAGDGKRVRKILDRADYAQGYADMLGLAKMNEKNFSADHIPDAGKMVVPPFIALTSSREVLRYDGETGEITEPADAADPGGDADTPQTVSSPDNQSPVLYQDPSAEADRDRGAVHEAGSEEGFKPLLPSDRVENKPDAPAVIAGVPMQEGSEPTEAHNLGRAGSTPAPATTQRNWKHSDPAHRDCLNPEQCGGFSNLALCGRCKAEAGITVEAAST